MPWYRLRNLLLGLFSLACLAFVGLVGYSLLRTPELYDTPIGGPFALQDSQGQARSDAAFRGSYLLIYFGYTYCPDICPTTLMAMTRALEALEREAPDKAGRVQPIFVTIDPARDTAEVLAGYVAHFHPAFVALTGSAEQVARAAEAYRVVYRAVETADSQDTLIDHSSYVYLMGPDGRYLAHYPKEVTAAPMAAGLAALVGSE